MTKEQLNSFLSENEQKALVQFNGSEVMKEAVRKVLLFGIYQNGVLKRDIPANATQNAAFWMVSNMPTASNEEVGSELKAVWQGINALEHAFDEIGKFQTEQKVEQKMNKAR